MILEAIIGIGVPLVGFIIWLAKRYVENKHDSVALEKKYEKELHKEIAAGDTRSINEYFNDRLSTLRGARRKQGDSSDEKR